jgi:hypothetical protein
MPLWKSLANAGCVCDKSLIIFFSEIINMNEATVQYMLNGRDLDAPLQIRWTESELLLKSTQLNHGVELSIPWSRVRQIRGRDFKEKGSITVPSPSWCTYMEKMGIGLGLHREDGSVDTIWLPCPPDDPFIDELLSAIGRGGGSIIDPTSLSQRSPFGVSGVAGKMILCIILLILGVLWLVRSRFSM